MWLDLIHEFEKHVETEGKGRRGVECTIVIDLQFKVTINLSNTPVRFCYCAAQFLCVRESVHVSTYTVEYPLPLAQHYCFCLLGLSYKRTSLITGIIPSLIGLLDPSPKFYLRRPTPHSLVCSLQISIDVPYFFDFSQSNCNALQ